LGINTEKRKSGGREDVKDEKSVKDEKNKKRLEFYEFLLDGINHQAGGIAAAGF
jgi:hypothetical protein